MTPSNPIPSRVAVGLGPVTTAAFEITGLVHGFCDRTGGGSADAFASFNLAGWIGDDPVAVAENWRLWNARYPNLPVASLSQVHGKLVHRVDPSETGPADNGATQSSTLDSVGRSHNLQRRVGDGMVTAAAGILLGIFTADCVPILMVDEDSHVAAALHAGWRGTLAGIAGDGVHAMTELGARPSSIRAALGPSIGPCCFEVDAALAQNFARQVPDASVHTRPGLPGKAYLDLRSIIRVQLEDEGLESTSIVNTGPCTRCANDRYFSRRGAAASKLFATSGLQMSFIGFAE
jgi:polyphenol oxidase